MIVTIVVYSLCKFLQNEYIGCFHQLDNSNKIYKAVYFNETGNIN